MPNYSTLKKQQYFKTNYLTSVNFGINILFKRNRFEFATGLLQMRQGSAYTSELNTTTQPEGGKGTYKIKIIMNGIYVPLTVNYLIPIKSTKIFVSAGIINGYIYDQKQVSSIFEIHDKYVKSYFFGYDVGFGVQFKLSEKLFATIKPHYIHQLRDNKLEENVLWKHKIITLSSDFGVNYTF